MCDQIHCPEKRGRNASKFAKVAFSPLWMPWSMSTINFTSHPEFLKSENREVVKINLRLATNFKGLIFFLVWQWWCFSIRDKYKNERNISIHQMLAGSDYKLVLGDLGGTVLKTPTPKKKLCVTKYIIITYIWLWPQFLKTNLFYFWQIFTSIQKTW